jgi:hypothetical protein
VIFASGRSTDNDLSEALRGHEDVA